MKFTVITLFPQMIEAFFAGGLVGQANSHGQIQLKTINPRDFAPDVHHTVDDRAYGGGDGMVMKFEPLNEAVKAAGEGRVLVLSPQGKPWNQRLAEAAAEAGQPLVLVCGRYAGIDQRFIEANGYEEVSLGDFVLNGGEVAACAVIESIARLRPQVLGNAKSPLHDSFSHGILECPQFTRPREVGGLPVPSPLLSGHHENVRQFEAAVGVLRTAYLRPDLLPDGISLKNELKQVAELTPVELKALGLSAEILKSLESLWVAPR